MCLQHHLSFNISQACFQLYLFTTISNRLVGHLEKFFLLSNSQRAMESLALNLNLADDIFVLSNEDAINDNEILIQNWKGDVKAR